MHCLARTLTNSVIGSCPACSDPFVAKDFSGAAPRFERAIRVCTGAADDLIELEWTAQTPIASIRAAVAPKMHGITGFILRYGNRNLKDADNGVTQTLSTYDVKAGAVLAACSPESHPISIELHISDCKCAGSHRQRLFRH
mgnify:CR=1 FL=1